MHAMKYVRYTLSVLVGLAFVVPWTALSAVGLACLYSADFIERVKDFLQDKAIGSCCLVLLAAALLPAPAAVTRESSTGPVAASAFLDTESSVCLRVTNGVASQCGFGFDLEFFRTPSNNVEVAFGRDADGDGQLSFSETEMSTGWDCGTYFVDPFAEGRRYDDRPSEELARGCGRTRMSYSADMNGLGNGMAEMYLEVGAMYGDVAVPEDLDDVDSGYDGDAFLFHPDGLRYGSRRSWKAAEWWSGEQGLSKGNRDRHVVGISLSGSRYYSGASVYNVRLSGGLRILYPSDGVPYGHRVVPTLFGLGPVVVSSGSGAVTVSSGSLSVGQSAEAYVYFTVEGTGDVHMDFTADHWSQIYVELDGQRRIGSGYYSYGGSSLQIRESDGYCWQWRPSWDTVRVTRRGWFPDGPSGRVWFSQRGGVFQLR